VHSQYLCERAETLKRIFARSVPSADWGRMNRPLSGPYQPEEELARRREYSEILERLTCSVFIGRCDPNDDNGYPARIFKWQYLGGLITPDTAIQSSRVKRLPKDAQYVRERRSELARQLALFLVADEAQVSPDYLRKICRKFEPDRDEGSNDIG